MLRREEGMTLVELMIGAALSLLVLGGVLATLVVADRTQVFGNRQSQAVSDATVAIQQLELHVRNADAVTNCDPANGTCLDVLVETPQGTDERFRYRLDGRELVRDRWNPSSSAFEGDRALADGILNGSQGVEIFSCPSPRLLEVSLRVSTDPQDDEWFTQETSLRPRNGIIGNC